MSILVVGTVAFDAIETPFGKTDKIVGGAATYICLSSSFFTKKLNLVSVVGEDFPKETIQMLKEKNVNTKGLQIKEGEKTFFWSGKYHNNMNTRDTMDTQLNVLENFQPVVPNNYKDADILVLGNLHPIVQSSVLDQMNSSSTFVILDTMNFWMDNTLDQLMEVIKRVEVITINDEEARQLTGEHSLVSAAKKIHDMGPDYVVIKKGEHGALLFNNENMFSAPALPLESVFDPTGAGDTFAGGFAGFLSKSQKINFESMKKAVVYGSALASFCVEKFGTERLKSLKSDEIGRRLTAFKKLTQFEIE